MSTSTRALDRAVDRLRGAASAVTRQRLIDDLDGPASRVVAFANPAPVRSFGPLRSAGLNVVVSLVATPNDETPDGWSANTRSYLVSLVDRDEREVLAWHWQPGEEYAGPDHPHLHVSAAVHFPDARGHRTLLDLDKLHLPTGMVSLAAVVRTLIDEFGVQPAVADWRARLGDAIG